MATLQKVIHRRNPCEVKGEHHACQYDLAVGACDTGRSELRPARGSGSPGPGERFGFSDAGIPINPIPFIGSGGGGEGLACLILGGVPELFVANNRSTVEI